MAVFQSIKARDSGYDWEVILQDLLENGKLNVGGPATSRTLSFSGYTLVLEGTGLAVSGARTLSAGNIESFTLKQGSTTIIKMEGLTAASAADFRSMMTGASGVDPYSAQFKQVIKPLFADEPVSGIGGVGNETLIGSRFTDTLNGNGGDDYIGGGAGLDVLDGGKGFDFVFYHQDSRTVGIEIDLAANTVFNNNTTSARVDYINSFEAVLATDKADIILGTTGRNVLWGLGGNDQINGRSGDNFYVPGEGNDTITGFNSRGVDGNWDKISYEFDDVVTGITVNFTTTRSVTILDPYGDTDTGTFIDEVKGTKNKDTFNGSSIGETVEGMAGNDKFNMGGGTDTVVYRFGTDTGASHGVIVNLSAATVIRNIGTGNQTVAANKGYDYFGDTDTFISVENVEGSDFKDVIIGSAGKNELNGYGGNDTLTGGAGNDNFNFAFTELGATNVDTITDFTVGVDSIILDLGMFGAITQSGGQLQTEFFRKNTTGLAQDSNDRIIYNSATGDLFYDENGVGGAAGIKFAVLSTKPATLSFADFDVF